MRDYSGFVFSWIQQREQTRLSPTVVIQRTNLHGITSDQSPSVQLSKPFSRMLCLSTASSDAVHVTPPPRSPLIMAFSS